MIDVNSLIPIAPVSVEPSVSCQEEVTAEQLIENKTKDEDFEPDPSSFIVLMTQVLSEAEESINTEYNTVEPTESKSDVRVLAQSKEPIVSETEPRALNEIIANQSINPTPTSIQKSNLIDNNVAMAWINSESYIPPQLINSENAELTLEKLQSLLKGEGADESLQEAGTANSKDQPIEHESLINAKNELIENLGSLNSYSSKILNALIPNLDSNKPVDATLDNEQPVVHLNNLMSQNTPNLITTTKTLSIPVALTDTQWENKFSEHIIWMGQNSVKSALIKLHPEELGPIEITIKVVKDNASVNITSHSGHVRDIVEQALPKLREMMSEQGLHLSEAHIGADSNSHQSNQQPTNPEQGFDTNTNDDVILTRINKRTTNSLIDYFA